MSPDMTASYAADVAIRARAWILDAVIDINSHPRLVNDSGSDTSKLSHEYVHSIFDRSYSFMTDTLKTMRGLDVISFSMPKDRSSLCYKDAVPVTGIMHGTHEISLDTVKAMFGRIDGFIAAWTPMHFGPGLPCKAITDHAMYKAFLDTSSPIPTDPITNIRVDFRGILGTGHAVIHCLKERSRVWMLEGAINSVLHKGLVNENVIFHDYLRQHIFSGNSVWEQSAEAWEFVSYAMQKDCSSLQNKDSVPLQGLFVHGSQAVRLQSFQSFFEGIPGLNVTWKPVYVGRGASFASTDVYREFLNTSTKDPADPNPKLMIRVDVKGNSDNA